MKNYLSICSISFLIWVSISLSMFLFSLFFFIKWFLYIFSMSSY